MQHHRLTQSSPTSTCDGTQTSNIHKNKRKTQSLETALSRKQQTLISDNVFTYRISALSEIAKANISVEQMQGMRNWIQENAKAGLTIGDCGELTRMYCRPVLDLHLETIRELIGKSYPEFSISVDGTPSFAGAECIMVRFVTNKLDIVELVARVGLFEKKLDSDNLANHILKCLIFDCPFLYVTGFQHNLIEPALTRLL